MEFLYFKSQVRRYGDKEIKTTLLLWTRDNKVQLINWIAFSTNENMTTH